MELRRAFNVRSTSHKVRSSAFIAALHLSPLLALYTGVDRADWLAFAILYGVSAFAVGPGLHRYFAHHAFKTSRAFQLLMAVTATTTFTDPIYFAGKHRLHHIHSDTDQDVHSPEDGFWYCWFGSLVDDGYTEKQITDAAAEWMRFPELRWLHRYYYLPGYTLAAITFLVGGTSMLVIGFCLSRALIIGQASAVNYFCHLFGTRRFDTPERSRNNALVALLTLGEGWHNNHHYYPASARAGFAWYEVDMFYWSIVALSWLGVVWDVKGLPERVRAAATG